MLSVVPVIGPYVPAGRSGSAALNVLMPEINPVSLITGAPTSGIAPSNVIIAPPAGAVNGLVNVPALPCDRMLKIGAPIAAPV